MMTYEDSLELEHYGVKGMKWGVRKAPNYSDRQRINDRRKYGRGSVRRINAELLKGKNINQARSKEAARKEKTKRVREVFSRIGKTGVSQVQRATSLGILMRKGPFASMMFDISVSRAAQNAQKIGEYVTEPLRKK